MAKALVKTAAAFRFYYREEQVGSCEDAKCCRLFALSGLALGILTAVCAEELPGAGRHVITVEKALELASDNNLALQAARLELPACLKTVDQGACRCSAVNPSPGAIRRAERWRWKFKEAVAGADPKPSVDLEVRSAYYAVLSQMQKKAIAEKRSLAQAEEHWK